MKSIRKVLALLFILGGFVTLFSLLHAQDAATQSTAPDSIVQLTAEAQGLSLVAPADVPAAGTFWVINANGIFSPYPGALFDPSYPVFRITSDEFLVDASGGQISTVSADGEMVSAATALTNLATEVVDLISQVQTAAAPQPMTVRMSLMAEDVPSPDDDGDTNDNVVSAALASYTPLNLVVTTNLWLMMTNLSGGVAGLMVSNTIADVEYEIQATTNLPFNATNYLSKGVFYGSELTNWTATSVTATDYPNLYLRIRSWQDDGSGLPIWWQLQYFGYVGVDPNGDPAGDGWSNIQKFEYDMNPNQAYPPPTPLNTNAPPPTFTIVPGPQGNLYLIGSGLPTDLSTLHVYRYSGQSVWNGLTYWPIGGGTSQFPSDLPNGSFDIPVFSITNGIALIPPSQLMSFGNYYLTVQTVRSNGVTSTPVYVYGNGYLYVTEYPFLDGRAQLKDNVRFLLRAAGGDGPFEANGVLEPVNYVYSGFYNSTAEFDPLTPFENNYFFRNFDFDINNLVSSNYFASYSDPNWYFVLVGIPDGVQLGNGFDWRFVRDINTVNLTYALNSASFISTNNIVAPSSWNTAQANWLFPPSSNDYIQDAFPEGGNGFGLSYVSALSPYYTNGVFLTETFYPNITPTNVPGGFYFDTVQPGLQTVGYYFVQAGTNLVPEQDNFSTTNTTPLLIVGVGQQTSYLQSGGCLSFQIAGYAKLAVTNGNPGVYAYLGQYFDRAYQITNGIVTANQTGVLSPYGQFFATQPGPTALLTMPDIDPPYQRGTCTVYAVSLNLDANHDGNMDLSFNGTDFTSANSPYVFWVNNNFDRWFYDADDNTNYEDTLNSVEIGNTSIVEQTPDCNYTNFFGNRIIPDTRDLEDFARLWISGVTSNLLAALPSGSTVTLNWGDVGNPNPNNPTIDIFAAADTDGGIGYLTNSTSAANQVNPYNTPFIQRLAPGGSVQLNTIQFANNWAGNHFIWCGVANGSGQLNLTIADGNGNVLAQASQWIQIVDIKQMYERWTVGDDPNVPPLTVAVKATDELRAAAFQYPPSPNTNTPYILFVHGWNLRTDDKDHFAETAFKRLYWQGYQGRFGSFRWPTGFGFSGIISAVTDARNYDNSESNAWASATGLVNLLASLNGEYFGNVYLMAHSMGNVVAGEALRLAGTNQLVNTYVAMQGAVPAHTYDSSTVNRIIPTPPDRYANYYTSGASSYFNGSAGAGSYVNFFNQQDYALGWWNVDQNNKPDNGIPYPGYHYSVSGLHPNGFYVQYGSGTNDFTNLNFPGDTYRIFAYADPAWSYALGAQPNVAGVFQKNGLSQQLNLPSVWPLDPLNNNYKAHLWHSVEFRIDNPPMWQFWQQVLTTMGLN